MSKRDDLPFEITHQVRDTCLCLHLQRAARAVARRFDAALRPLGLTNGQFSLLMSLNRPDPPSIGSVSVLLARDRTTLTANLKPLERRGLVQVTADAADKRTRRLTLPPPAPGLAAAARVRPDLEATASTDRPPPGRVELRPAARRSARAFVIVPHSRQRSSPEPPRRSAASATQRPVGETKPGSSYRSWWRTQS